MSEHEGNQSLWHKSFSDRVRSEQREDDSTAWWTIISLLLAIISIGLSLAFYAIWACS